MINKSLFYHLTGYSPEDKPTRPAPRLIAKPDTLAACFLEEGYVMEVYSMTGTDGTVSWFWGPKEFIIPTLPYSNLVMLTKEPKTQNISYGDMIRTLRKFLETQVHYWKIREQHHLQVTERIHNLQTLTPLEQYVKLLQHKPWVFSYAKEEHVASYLSVSVELLRQFRQGQA